MTKRCKDWRMRYDKSMNQRLIRNVILLTVLLAAIVGTAAVWEKHAGLFGKLQNLSLYKPTLDYEAAVVKAVERTLPSVVSIVVTKNVPIIEECVSDPFANLPDEFRRFFGGFEFVEPCERGTETREIGGGSGFIVSADGLIVTNKHVVLDEEAAYTAILSDGTKYDAKVIARDPVQDIAILKIEAEGLTAATLGDSDSLKLGQTAIAIGNALGEFTNTVSVGAISGLARTITAGGDGGFVEEIQGVIQTDAAINAGNSGGPLLNLHGEVVGVNTAMAEGAQSIGFAIPVNRVKRDIDSVAATGAIQTPFLGVRYRIVTEAFAEENNLPVGYGALIEKAEDGPAVVPDSAAARAGLKEGDIILEAGGKRITERASLGTIILEHRVGETLTLLVMRGGEKLTLTALLAERPISE